jgi:hypothetical protein
MSPRVLLQPWRRSLPPPRKLHVAGDELSSPGRLIHLFRDSYLAAQGRQWLQAYVLAWAIKHLRQHNVKVDRSVLTTPALADKVTHLGLPPGHTVVLPGGQASMNFDLWWSLFINLIQMNNRLALSLPPLKQYLPDATGLEARAWNAGLRPWMSSSNWEELSGAIRALEFFRAHDRFGWMDSDEVMVKVTLPSMLLAELYWLRKDDQGRPRKRGDRFEVLFLTRCRRAHTAWSAGQYLSALDAAYLRASDIIEALCALQKRPRHPLLRRILDLYDEMLQAYNERHPGELAPADAVSVA